ncbi:hypothetical protein BROUX41_005202 [Berkeleyomyces rouxiae]|uniref:uncharacterized protein n=1 Tax=Berkeleyomyces rouxiae TaxID=2035830 RepID=UPI003B7E9536
MASKAGKRDFLACYRTARQLTFSQKNITAAFRTSGQWPVDLTRPLQSPKLREASNQDPSSRGEGTPECDETASTVTWTTPKKSIDVQKQLALFSRLQGSNATQRLLFRKIQKACDEREFELATLKLEYEALKEEVEFARVLSRNRSQMAASSDNHIMGRSNGIGSFAQVEDCVVVSARAVEK